MSGSIYNYRPALVLFVLALPLGLQAESGRNIKLTLTLISGGQVKGQVSEFDDDKVVVQARGKARVVLWDDVSTPSAYQAKKQLLEAIRGSARNLTAEDHFQLGYFLAVRNHHSTAVSEFRRAQARDPSFKERIKKAWRQIRRQKERNIAKIKDPLHSSRIETRPVTALNRQRPGVSYQKYTEQHHREAVEVFKQFGEEVREKIASDLVLLETRHFLIWTDWTESTRDMIPIWAERMYNMLCDELGFSKHEPIWMGKCPIFCFKTKARFDRFAKIYDHHDSGKMLGYAKTADNGYVHVVLRRLGSSQADLNRFATTMVHEGTHAFMHCYRSPRNLPPWISEGYADYIAERVLKDVSLTGESARIAALRTVRQKKSIMELFEYDKSPPGHFYPIAHSLVQYLIEKDTEAFVGMIDEIKSGMDGKRALAKHYNGLNANILDHSWRLWVPKTYTSKK